MGYIGNQQTEGFSKIPPKQDLTGATGSTLTLSNAVSSPESIDLFINNVRQEPTTSYTTDGTTVNLVGYTVAATDDIYVIYNALAQQTSIHPSTAALEATSVKINGGNLELDAGDIGVGTASPLARIHINKGAPNIRLEDTDANGYTDITANNTRSGLRFRCDPDGVDADTDIRFDIDGTEKMRIDEDHIYVGTTLTDLSAVDAQGFFIKTNPTDAIPLKIEAANQGTPTLTLHRSENDNNGRTLVRFQRKGANVGTISATNTTTTYNTTSDYRLKENVATITGATERLKQLNPVRFNFITDTSKTVDGFLAHEVSTVVPEAVTGAKDAVDLDGNPDYQEMDASKLIPILVATIKELEARITTLEAE